MKEGIIILREEILKIIRRRQFLIIFFLLFLVSILDFLITCKSFYGSELSWVRSAYQCTILHNTIHSFSVQFFTTLFPLIVCIPASDLYFEEKDKGISNFIFTRAKKNQNINKKIISIGIVIFFMICIPLLINFLLVLVAFPIQGHYSANVTYLTLTVHQSDRMLAVLEASHPYLNIIVYILIRSLLGVTFALLSFSVSLLDILNRYIILFIGLLFDLLYNFITAIPNNELLNTNIWGINTYGSIWMVVLYFVICWLLIFIFVQIGKKKECL